VEGTCRGLFSAAVKPLPAGAVHCHFMLIQELSAVTQFRCAVRMLSVRLRLKCDGTRAETRIRLSAKRTSLFKSAGAVSSVKYGQPRCAHQG
jgi:hypothetical protein